MKQAFSRWAIFVGHTNADFAAASRRLTVGRPFKAGTWVTHVRKPRRIAALESRPPLGFAISSVALRRVRGLGSETGLERPV